MRARARRRWTDRSDRRRFPPALFLQRTSVRVLNGIKIVFFLWNPIFASYIVYIVYTDKSFLIVATRRNRAKRKLVARTLNYIRIRAV